jgi:hypothetical protein
MGVSFMDGLLSFSCCDTGFLPCHLSLFRQCVLRELRMNFADGLGTYLAGVLPLYSVLDIIYVFKIPCLI